MDALKDMAIGFLTDGTTIATMALFVVGLVAVLVKGKAKADALVQVVIPMLVAAFTYAEKAIPDDTQNKGLKRADVALKAFVSMYAKVFGNTPPQSVLDLAKKMWAAWASEHKALVAVGK